MSLKTEYSYPEDNFVQRGVVLDELTVTITLCEYRNLITEQMRLDMVVDRLEQEKADLEKKLKAASEAIAVCKMPDWVKSIGNVLAHWGENHDNGEDERENVTQKEVEEAPLEAQKGGGDA